MRFWKLLASTLLLTACGSKRELSASKVTNGVRIAEGEFPAVRQILRRSGSSNYICSGTFISDNALLTAAHCVDTQIPWNNRLESTGEHALHAWRHLDYHGSMGGSDLGLLIFPDHTATEFASIRAALPKKGDPLVIVGYGNNEVWTTSSWWSGKQITGSGAGIKRKGSNVVASLDHGMIRFYGVPGRTPSITPGENVLSASGDSGGPLFIDSALAGITSGGWTDIASYVDLTSWDSLGFLDFANSKGAHLNRADRPILNALQSVSFDHHEGRTSYWKWTISLQGDTEQVLCVNYHLDQTFQDQSRRNCDRENDFALTEIGWGGFTIRLDLELTQGRRMTLRHELKLP